MLITTARLAPNVVVQFRDPTQQEIEDTLELMAPRLNETDESPTLYARTLIALRDLGEAVIVGGCIDDLACIAVGRATVQRYREGQS